MGRDPGKNSREVARAEGATPFHVPLAAPHIRYNRYTDDAHHTTRKLMTTLLTARAEWTALEEQGRHMSYPWYQHWLRNLKAWSIRQQRKHVQMLYAEGLELKRKS